MAAFDAQLNLNWGFPLAQFAKNNIVVVKIEIYHFDFHGPEHQNG